MRCREAAQSEQRERHRNLRALSQRAHLLHGAGFGDSVAGEDHGAIGIADQLGRAVETMRLTCAAAGWDAAACRLDTDVREISLGAYDGLTRDEIPDFDGLRARHAEAGGFYFHCPGGERWDEAAARLRAGLARIDPEAETVMFSHGVSGKLLRGLTLGLDRSAIAALDSPHDAFFRLEAGRMERIAAAPSLLG